MPNSLLTVFHYTIEARLSNIEMLWFIRHYTFTMDGGNAVYAWNTQLPSLKTLHFGYMISLLNQRVVFMVNHPDALSKYLEQLGFAVEPYYLKESSFQLGNQITINDFQIVYRTEDSTVIFIIYRRLTGKKGLKNAFLAFDAFLYILSQTPNILEVKGTANALTTSQNDGLPTTKLNNVYKQWFNGKTSHWENGNEWLTLQLADYQPYFSTASLKKAIVQPLQTIQ